VTASDPNAVEVRYWVFNYEPQWEAVSKEIDTLRAGLGDGTRASVVGLNLRDRRLQWRGPIKRIPLPHGLPLYPLLRSHAGAGGGINHLFASAAERWLAPMLAVRRGILTVAKGSPSLAAIERNAATLRRFRAVVVQSEWDRDVLRQVGVAERSLRLIRPGIPVSTYREASGPFTILFASSPFGRDDFLTRGIQLLVRVASRLPDVRFLLAWRGRHLAKLRGLIGEAGAANIEIRDGVIQDMGAVYDQVHAAALPALEHRSFIPAPRSGLEALAHGKPLLVSRYVSIAEPLVRAGAGVAFDPTVRGLETAVHALRERYRGCRAAAQPYIERHFSPSIHLELHRRLYRSLGR
jgi:glycosyltransferase involved in cell wall biosynthesis